MRGLRFCSVTLVVLLLASVLQPAEASCSNPRLFSSGDHIPEIEVFSYVYTPGAVVGADDAGLGGSSVTANFDGAFWALGFGDPAINAGHDNGDWPIFDWFVVYPNYPAFFGATWAQDQRIDGCIDSVPTACMAIQLTDVNPQSGEVVFAVMSQVADRNKNYGFGQPGDAPFILAPLADPQVVGVAATQSGLSLDMAPLEAADFSDGFYLDPECGGGTLESHVPGACWLTQVLPGGSPPPADTNLESAGWNETGICTGFSQPVSLPIDCDQGSDVYVAYVLVNESDMPLQRTSRASIRVDCTAQEQFARFKPHTAKLTFGKHGDGFRFWGRYALNEDSDGVFPDREDVTVSFGSYSETIPAGSFSCRRSDCVYRGEGSGITHASITRRFVSFQGNDIDLSTTANPLALVVTIGDDFGEAVVRLSGSLHFVDPRGNDNGIHVESNDSDDIRGGSGPSQLESRGN